MFELATTAASILTPQLAEQILQFLKKRNSDEFINRLPNKNPSRNQIIKKISKNFKENKLVFVLGAGISMSYGLPNWDTLLQKLMITTINEDENASAVLAQFFTSIFQPSSLIAGRYLQKFFEDKQIPFEQEVQKAIYQNIDLSQPSPLIDEIISYCVAPGKSPNLDSIISYNFDNILEQKLKQLPINVPFKSIYGGGINPKNHLPIYHVHGYLPQDENLTEQNLITFGESIYHKQYTDIYSWNNIVQINKFRDYNCLFIGTSLTDPNTRRLLDIAKKQRFDENGSHYIFSKRYEKEKIKLKVQTILKENKALFDEKVLALLELDETVDKLIKIIERFEENDKDSFGIKTIWINDFPDIPPILKEIKEME